MSELAVWFERKFTFDFPVELNPNLRIRLRGAPPRLEELVRGLRPDLLITRLQEKWSLQENAGHLLDLEELWTARVDEFLSGTGVLTAADVSNTKTHQARHNDRAIDEILAAFRKSRLSWVSRLDSLLPSDFARVARHPRLGVPMRLVDHLYFVAEHDDHHLARIWELRRLLTR